MGLDLNTQDWVFGACRQDPDEEIGIVAAEQGAVPASRRHAVDSMTEIMRDGVYNEDSHFLLTMTRSNAKRSLVTKKLESPMVGVMVNHLNLLAQKAVWIESHTDVEHDSKHVQGIHIFAVPVLVENDLYRVQLLVRDYVDTDSERTAIHTIDGVEIAKMHEKTRSFGTAVFSLSDVPEEGRYRHNLSERVDTFTVQANHQKIKLSTMLHGYNRADGKGYFESIDKSEFLSYGVYSSPVRDAIVQRELTELAAKKFITKAQQDNQSIHRKDVECFKKDFSETLSLYRLKGHQFGISEKSVAQIIWAMGEINKQKEQTYVCSKTDLEK